MIKIKKFALGTFWVHQLRNHINEQQNRIKMIRFRNKKQRKTRPTMNRKKRWSDEMIFKKSVFMWGSSKFV